MQNPKTKRIDPSQARAVSLQSSLFLLFRTSEFYKHNNINNFFEYAKLPGLRVVELNVERMRGF